MIAKSILEVSQDMIKGSPQGAKALADELGVPLSTLYGQFNPNDARHKPDLELWVRAMRATGNHLPLHRVAQELDHVAVRVPTERPHDRDLLLQVSQVEQAAAKATVAVLAKVRGRLAGEGAGELLKRINAAYQDQGVAAQAAMYLFAILGDIRDEFIQTTAH